MYMSHIATKSNICKSHEINFQSHSSDRTRPFRDNTDRPVESHLRRGVDPKLIVPLLSTGWRYNGHR